MKRRILVVACLIGIVGGGAGTAFANPPADHQVCVVFSNAKDSYQSGQYICVNALGNN